MAPTQGQHLYAALPGSAAFKRLGTGQCLETQGFSQVEFTRYTVPVRQKSISGQFVWQPNGLIPKIPQNKTIGQALQEIETAYKLPPNSNLPRLIGTDRPVPIEQMAQNGTVGGALGQMITINGIRYAIQSLENRNGGQTTVGETPNSTDALLQQILNEMRGSREAPPSEGSAQTPPGEPAPPGDGSGPSPPPPPPPGATPPTVPLETGGNTMSPPSPGAFSFPMPVPGPISSMLGPPPATIGPFNSTEEAHAYMVNNMGMSPTMAAASLGAPPGSVTMGELPSRSEHTSRRPSLHVDTADLPLNATNDQLEGIAVSGSAMEQQLRAGRMSLRQRNPNVRYSPRSQRARGEGRTGYSDPFSGPLQAAFNRVYAANHSNPTSPTSPDEWQDAMS